MSKVRLTVDQYTDLMEAVKAAEFATSLLKKKAEEIEDLKEKLARAESKIASQQEEFYMAQMEFKDRHYKLKENAMESDRLYTAKINSRDHLINSNTFRQFIVAHPWLVDDYNGWIKQNAFPDAYLIEVEKEKEEEDK